MAKRTIYATFRIDLEADTDEITDEMVEAFTGTSLYDIPGVDVNIDGKILPLKVSDTVWENTQY